MKHTPAPWTFNPSTLDLRTLGYCIESESLGWVEVICACETVDGEEPQEDIERKMANAQLIAAAPEILEALRSALSLILATSGPQLVGEEREERIAPIRAAIAKAEGK